jgi:hypothetical protein
MTRFVGLDVSQKMTVICVVDDAGRSHGSIDAGCFTRRQVQVSVLSVQGALRSGRAGRNARRCIVRFDVAAGSLRFKIAASTFLDRKIIQETRLRG